MAMTRLSIQPVGLIRTDKVKSFWCEWPVSQLLALREGLGAVLTCESIERLLAMFVILLSQSKDGAAGLLRMWHTIPDHRAENLTKIIGIPVASC